MPNLGRRCHELRIRDESRNWRIVYRVDEDAAFSLGFNNPVYRFLYANVWPMQGFRAPARFGILTGCALAVLAGFGFDYLAQRFSRSRLRNGLLIAVLVAIGVECGSAPMRLDELPRQTPDVYRFLRILDQAVVIELPIAELDLAPVYMYWSTQHWHRLVNGYSGFAPPGYRSLWSIMADFPDPLSRQVLRNRQVRYVVIHWDRFDIHDASINPQAVKRTAWLRQVGRFRDADVFEVAPDGQDLAHR